MPFSTTVCGYAQSTAYRFAYAGKRKIEYITVQGDVNVDTKPDIADVVIVQKWLLGGRNIKLNDWEGADFTQDGQIDAFDLVLMKGSLIAQQEKLL